MSEHVELEPGASVTVRATDIEPPPEAPTLMTIDEIYDKLAKMDVSRRAGYQRAACELLGIDQADLPVPLRHSVRVSISVVLNRGGLPEPNQIRNALLDALDECSLLSVPDKDVNWWIDCSYR